MTSTSEPKASELLAEIERQLQPKPLFADFWGNVLRLKTAISALERENAAMKRDHEAIEKLREGPDYDLVKKNGKVIFLKYIRFDPVRTEALDPADAILKEKEASNVSTKR